MTMLKKMLTLALLMAALPSVAQPPRPFHRPTSFVTDTVMVHDPVLAFEDGTYYLLSTGRGVQWATSKDRQTWVVQSTPYIEHIPQWTHDSVPGFRDHVWAPDVIRWHDTWWLAYSCSTFGRNTSAIGLMTAQQLNGRWTDRGCLVASREGRDQWNAIDPCFVVDDEDQLWLTWGSFWDGIQLARLHVEAGAEVAAPDDKADAYLPLTVTCEAPVTVACRYNLERNATESREDIIASLPVNPNPPKNPTSDFAGPNAIEAPFILHHGGWYYLFVSWDYCCQGSKSNYRVAVGRSKQIGGPYVDSHGVPMLGGGGDLLLEGDKQQFEAAGHCAVYDLPSGPTLFICHGYSVALGGASILIQREVEWTADGWPRLKE